MNHPITQINRRTMLNISKTFKNSLKHKKTFFFKKKKKTMNISVCNEATTESQIHMYHLYMQNVHFFLLKQQCVYIQSMFWHKLRRNSGKISIRICEQVCPWRKEGSWRPIDSSTNLSHYLWHITGMSCNGNEFTGTLHVPQEYSSSYF